MRFFPTNHKPLFFAILAVGLGAPLAVWMLAPGSPSQWLAKRLWVQMQQAELDQIDFYAQQLAALGKPGWEELLSTLRQDRVELRNAAQKALVRAVQQWRSQSSAGSSEQISQLASTLVRRLNHASTEELYFYGDVAERILDGPSVAGDGTSLVYDCEQIMRAARKIGWPRRETAEPAEELLTAESPSFNGTPQASVLPTVTQAQLPPNTPAVEPNIAAQVDISEPSTAAEPISQTAFADETAGKTTRRYYVVAVDALGQAGFPSSPVWFDREWKSFYTPFLGEWHQ